GGGRHYDLMVSLNGLATALLAKADAKGAANALRESVAITRQFAEHHSQDANWQDMLAVAYDKHADALALCNDTEQSLGMYASAMKILDALSAKEPSNTERSMSVHGNANKI